jgi:negative regulator of flagellin synthesis FlgM
VASKINGIEGGGGASAGTSRVSQRGSRGVPVSSQTSSDVHITDTATQLAALEQTVSDLPAVNESRVAQMRTAIEQGTYQVAPQQVADRLTQLEQALSVLPLES